MTVHASQPQAASRALRGLRAGLLALFLVAGAGCAHAGPGRPLAAGVGVQLPRPDGSRVVVIVMENAEYGEVIGNFRAPFLNALAERYGLMTHSFAITHPSLPNYLALTGGSTAGISSDCSACAVSAPNIVDELEGAGISWRAYLEGAPHACFRPSSAGGYAKKHNPFIYYTDVAGSPQRCRHLVGFGRLSSDLRGGRLPTYSWITPNLCDDGHDCGVRGADKFAARTVPLLLKALGRHGFLVLTWDEGTSDAGCCAIARGGHIATILAGPQIRRGGRVAAPVDHYGVLATIEAALRLRPLAGAGSPANGSARGLFVSPPHLR